jgi:hypothetical protein
MRIILLSLACLIVFASCNDKSISKEVTKVDTIAVTEAVAAKPVEVSTAPLTPMDSIKQEVARINTANLPSKSFSFKCDEMVKITYHYTGKEISKVTIDWGTVGDAYQREEFYYKNGRLIFDYDLLEGAGAYEGGDKKLERRHYVINDKAVKYMENDKVLPCKYCDYAKSSKPYKMLAAEATHDFESVLCK